MSVRQSREQVPPAAAGQAARPRGHGEPDGRRSLHRRQDRHARNQGRSCRKYRGRSAVRRKRKAQAGRLAGESGPMMRTQVGRPGDPATRRPGDPATRRPGDPATRRPGDPATRRPGDPATRRPGDPATRRPGDHYSGGVISVCQALARTIFRHPAVQTQRPHERSSPRAQRVPSRVDHHDHRVPSEPVARHHAACGNTHLRRASPVPLPRTLCRARMKRKTTARAFASGMAAPARSPSRTMRLNFREKSACISV